MKTELTKEQFEAAMKGARFKQSAFSKAELAVQPLVSILVAACIYRGQATAILAKFGTGFFLLDLPLKLVLAFFSLLLAIFLKYVFYKIVGILNGVEYMGGGEEFWLFDWPANPINLPAILIFERPEGNPDEIIEQVYQKLLKRNAAPHGRFDHKVVKILGKYYFKRLTEGERTHFRKNNFKVFHDVTDYQGVLDFANKLKQIEVKLKDASPLHFFYFPKIGANEACIIGYGPHLYQDGISSMQQVYQLSD